MVHTLQWVIVLNYLQYCSAEDSDGGVANLVRPSVWPLSEWSLGYEVFLDEPSGQMHGREFIQSPVTSQMAFHLNGETFVDISYKGTLSLRWSLVAYVYLQDMSSGVLYDLVNTGGNTIFRVWITNGKLQVQFYSPILDLLTTQSLPIKSWFQLAISRLDNGLVIYSDEKQIGFDSDYFPSQSVLKAGTLRIGKRFSGPVDSTSFSIWCFRTYSDFIPNTRMLEASMHCYWDPLWKYKGPYGCMNEPCVNQATCEDYHTLFYICMCAAGYSGKNCQTVIQRDIDEGYFILIASNHKPDDTDAIMSAPSSSARDCGMFCVKTPGCQSFATDSEEGKVFQCTLYNDIVSAISVSKFSKYYIKKN